MNATPLRWYPPDWTEQALCAEVDPELHFPEKGGSTAPAKRICAACSVRAECLEYAIEHAEPFGVWGGMSERERRSLRRKQPRLMCGNGQHLWNEENIYVAPDGTKSCRPCRTANCQRSRAERGSAAPSPSVPQPRKAA